MSSFQRFVFPLALTLVGGVAHARKPQKAPVAEKAPVVAPDSVGAAALDDPQLAAQLGRLSPEMRSRIEAMPMAAFEAALDSESPTAEQTAVAEAFAAIVTIGDAAMSDPNVAAMLAAVPEGDRARVAEMRTTHLEAISGQPRETLSAEDAELLSAVATGWSAHAFSSMTPRHGDVPVGDALATLHLGDEFAFLGPDDAVRVISEYWDNPAPTVAPLGMIIPKGSNPISEKGWGIVVTYLEEGHVDDDDGDDIDYDELLEEMRADETEENAERVRAGFSPIHLVGWAAPPRYDAETHRLYWARELATTDAEIHSLNYDVRVLGRKGVLSLNAVSGMSEMDDVRPAMEDLLGRVEFEAGSRYADFDPDLDEVAAYGIGGLVAGKVALKAGLFAGLLKLLIAGKKAVLLVIVAIGAGLTRLFRRNRDG